MKQEAQLSQRGRAMQGRIQKVEWGGSRGPGKAPVGGSGGRSPPGPKISQNVNYTDRGTIEGTKARHGGAKPEGVGSGNFEI